MEEEATRVQTNGQSLTLLSAGLVGSLSTERMLQVCTGQSTVRGTYHTGYTFTHGIDTPRFHSTGTYYRGSLRVFSTVYNLFIQWVDCA